MKLKNFAIGLSLLTISGLVSAEMVSYKIDPTHTATVFTWNHLGFSTPSANFSDIQGTIQVDNADPAKSSVSVTIPVKSLNTNVPVLDTKLQESDWFNTAKYPNISFQSTKVETTDKKTFKISGNLTVKGVTKPVVLDAVLNNQAQHPMLKVPAIGFNASTTIKRSDFDIAAYVPAVSDTIDIQITTEALAVK
ncbi:YceI family protein [Acinetobacter piscicola]|uniref:YceI family protein n=1 Tax=Acinetobacter piscicola TaxID=2006115 RepID=UPI000B7EB4C5|nr:YceI family protein [Acinetobacter piscicola]